MAGRSLTKKWVGGRIGCMGVELTTLASTVPITKLHSTPVMWETGMPWNGRTTSTTKQNPPSGDKKLQLITV